MLLIIELCSVELGGWLHNMSALGHHTLLVILCYVLCTDDCCLLTGDQPDISSKLCQAMEALQDRPVLFKWEPTHLLLLSPFTLAHLSALLLDFFHTLELGQFHKKHRGQSSSTIPFRCLFSFYVYSVLLTFIMWAGIWPIILQVGHNV